MKLSYLLVAFLLLAGCASRSTTPVMNTDGARSPLADPSDNTLNSPTTGPSSAGLPGGPDASGTAAPGPIPTAVGPR